MCSKNSFYEPFALSYKFDQRLKNEQIYYVGQITVIIHIYFDFAGCRVKER